jgi:hypothetical protein
MDHIVQRLQVETLKAQLALFQLGRAYLAGRSESAEELNGESVALMELIQRAGAESSVLQAQLSLVQGNVKPLWG